MRSIYIQPICESCDPVDARFVCECVERFYVGRFDVVQAINPIPPPPDCRYNGKGNRLRVEKLVSFLGQRHDGIILGLTNEDISGSKDGHPDWGVLGYAEGKTCVLSTYRMGGRQDRLGKAAVHEVGHLLGLGHCPTPECLMNDARGKLATLDRAADFCRTCRARVGLGEGTVGGFFDRVEGVDGNEPNKGSTGIGEVKMRTFAQIGLGSIAAAASRMQQGAVEWVRDDVGVGQRRLQSVKPRCLYAVQPGDDFVLLVSGSGSSVAEINAMNGNKQPVTYWITGNRVVLPKRMCEYITQLKAPRRGRLRLPRATASSQYSFARFGIAGPFAPTVPQQTGVGGVQWEDG